MKLRRLELNYTYRETELQSAELTHAALYIFLEWRLQITNDRK